MPRPSERTSRIGAIGAQGGPDPLGSQWSRWERNIETNVLIALATEDLLDLRFGAWEQRPTATVRGPRWVLLREFLRLNPDSPANHRFLQVWYAGQPQRVAAAACLDCLSVREFTPIPELEGTRRPPRVARRRGLSAVGDSSGSDEVGGTGRNALFEGALFGTVRGPSRPAPGTLPWTPPGGTPAPTSLQPPSIQYR